MAVDTYSDLQNVTKGLNRPSRLHHDPLDNGTLMRLAHHKGYDTFPFSIHPDWKV